MPGHVRRAVVTFEELITQRIVLDALEVQAPIRAILPACQNFRHMETPVRSWKVR